jgi:ABC-type methionine transport system permease subunit
MQAGAARASAMAGAVGAGGLGDLAIRAAHALGMPISTVSRKVTALEERLGVTRFWTIA